MPYLSPDTLLDVADLLTGLWAFATAAAVLLVWRLCRAVARW